MAALNIYMCCLFFMGYGSTVQSSDTLIVNMIILPAKHSEVWDTEVGAGLGGGGRARIKFVDKKGDISDSLVGS